MRCLALGHAWRACGGTAALLSYCPNDWLRQRIESAGVGLIPLNKPHPDPSDLNTTLSRLEEFATQQARAPWLALDGYHFNPAYQRAVRMAGYRLLVIDDTAHIPHYHAHIVLNQNIRAEGLSYCADPDTLLLLGPRYALLRPEFRAWRGSRREVPDAARKILVTLGGADPNNISLRVIRALQQAAVDGLEAVVVLGAYNPHRQTLQLATQDSKIPIRLEFDVINMPELMGWADVAISGGGSTCWELAFLGLPSLLLALAENQRGIADGLGKAGAAVNLGWYEQVTSTRIADELVALCEDPFLRRRLSQTGRSLVDGSGIERIVAVITGMGSSVLDEDRLELRSATLEDAVQIWRLANDPTVRANSFRAEPIPLKDHMQWYQHKLSSPDTRIWVLEIGGIVAAQIRYDRISPDTAELHFSVAAAFRGKGLGTKMLTRTWQRCCKELDVRRVLGVAFLQNAASIRAFEKAGFRRVEEGERHGRLCYTFERACS